MLITEGAGFMGGDVAVALSQAHSDWEITAFHNLRRRGSELNLPRLREAGVSFVHGDVRMLDNLVDLPAHEAIVECSAEPSVLAGTEGSPDHFVQSNLIGAYRCLEYARRHLAQLIFLSSSRVYPIGRSATWCSSSMSSVSCSPPSNRSPVFLLTGAAKDFPLTGARSIYGATKLAAELLLQSIPGRVGDRVAQAIVQQRPVGEARERVVDGVVARLLAPDMAFRHD